MKITISLLFILFFINPSAQAVTSSQGTNNFVVNNKSYSKKKKNKIIQLQKWQNKWNKNKNKKQRKSRFGRIGLLILLGGLVSLFLTDVLFLMALLGAMVFGIIGIIKDENKLAAYLAAAIPVIFILIALIAVASDLGD